MKPLTCVGCGNPLKEGQRFCTVCGTQQPQQPQYTEPAYDQYDTGEQLYDYAAPVQTGKKPKLPLIIGIATGVLLLITVVLSIVFLVKSNAPVQTDPPAAHHSWQEANHNAPTLV